jgi:hypothetical protein
MAELIPVEEAGIVSQYHSGPGGRAGPEVRLCLPVVAYNGICRLPEDCENGKSK